MAIIYIRKSDYIINYKHKTFRRQRNYQSGMIMVIKPYLDEMRIKSWVKNAFVFIPITFALQLTNVPKLIDVLFAFLAFCFVSSSVYVFNDIFDSENDAFHPIKCHRPIASGIISIRNALIFSIALAITGLTITCKLNIYVSIIVFAYLLLNILYTTALKHIPLIDCFCIATGFVLRVFAGSLASDEPVSDWLFLTIVTMSLFMAFGKRHGEINIVEMRKTRRILSHYNPGFLNAMMYTCAGLFITFYSLWTMEREMNMIYTVPIVIFLVSKYILLINNLESHGDPTTMLFQNKTLLISVAGYCVVTLLFLYVGA